jgi:PAS domain S-box-containing protein
MMDGQPKLNETKQQSRKRARSAKAIGESEEWLFLTLESIGDAVIATDADGLIVFMNQVAVTLTGWNEEEAEGKACRDVFHIVNETTRHETESPVAKVIRDGVIAGLANHTILIARDGTEHNIDDSGSPIRDKEGHLIGVVLIFRDITARRKTELTLHEQQEILQTLFDHIPVIVTFLDTSGQFKWVNREWMRLIGWSLEEMQLPERRAAFDPKAVTGEADEDTPNLLGWRGLKVVVKDGRTLDLSWTTVRLIDGSSIGIGQDITQRKIAEDHKAQLMAQLEVSNRQLQQAMRETDHRVKNNLQSIGALLDIQVMEHDQSVPVKELAQVRTHISTLATMHELLIQDVKAEGLDARVSAMAAVNKMLPMLQQIVGKPRIQWTVQDVSLPIKQGMSLAVLINELVNNAVKHGGQHVELRLAAVEDHVTLEVCDDGPGFAEEFNPRRAGHFGLELVESIGRLDLGGATAYVNRPEGGACVRVTFPLPPLSQIREA